MTNTLTLQRQPNYQRDFSYVNPRNNFPIADIRRVEENLINVVLVEAPEVLEALQSKPLTKQRPKTDLPLASDYGDNVGYEQMLSIRGPLRCTLQYA